MCNVFKKARKWVIDHKVARIVVTYEDGKARVIEVKRKEKPKRKQ